MNSVTDFDSFPLDQLASKST